MTEPLTPRDGNPAPWNSESPLDQLGDLGMYFTDGLPDGPLTPEQRETLTNPPEGFTTEEALMFLSGVTESAVPAQPVAASTLPPGIIVAAVDATTGEEHTGAMIALIPSAADKTRVAITDGEPVDQLHVTLAFLGEAVDISADAREAIIQWARSYVEGRDQISANAFAAALFNPGTDHACWVLEVGEVDPENPLLAPMRDDTMSMISAIDGLEIPPQHEPWRPHVTLIYDGTYDWAWEVADATGPIVLDTLRVSFGSEVIDFPLVTPSQPNAAALYSANGASGGGVVTYHVARRTDGSWAIQRDDDGFPVGVFADKQTTEQMLGRMLDAQKSGKFVVFVDGKMFTHESDPTPTFNDTLADAPIVDLTGEPDAGEDGTELPPVGSWEGVLAVEGSPTGDGRQFNVGALTWAELPIPLLWQKQVIGEGHMGQVTAGNITEIWRDGNQIRGRGNFDLNGTDGQEAYRQVREGFLKGLSIDPDSISEADIEYVYPEGAENEAMGDGLLFGPMPELTIFHAGRIRATTLVQIPAFVEAGLWLTDGQQLTTSLAVSGGVDETHYSGYSDEPWDADAQQAKLARLMPLETAYSAFAFISGARELTVARGQGVFLHHEIDESGKPGVANITACTAGIAAINADTTLDFTTRVAAYEHLAAHIRSAGLVPLPLANAKTLVAATHTIQISDVPPAHWFNEPTDVSVHGALTVTDEGRVYGYLAPANVAHRSFGSKSVFVPTNVDYTRFRGRETIVEGGARIATGCITMNCGHASTDGLVDGGAAIDHYDNSCSIVASVSVGENARGVWVAGALLPDVTPDQVTRMMACQLSGDWRPLHQPVNGKTYELAGMLLVPVPGFPMARSRPSVQVKDGQLVASAVPVRFVRDDAPVVATSNPLHAAAQRIARSIGRDRGSRVAELKARIHGR